MVLPIEVREILDKLNKNGYRAFVVGGAVRDFLLGKEPHDYDITTNALPEEVIELFKEYETVRIGERFGTVGVIVNKQLFEITTFRKESDYENHRKPMNVEFVNKLLFDLSRRDFTINAIAFDKNYFDIYDGMGDISNKIIRTVGDPLLRFEEDGLRVLRAIRFAATLGFRIEENTETAMFNSYEYALCSSIPRRAVELRKMLNGEYLSVVISKYREILNKFLKIFDYDDYIPHLTKNFLKNILLMYYHHQEILKDDFEFLQLSKEEVRKIKDTYLCIKEINFDDITSIVLNINKIIKSKDVFGVLLSAIDVQQKCNLITFDQYNKYTNNLFKLLDGPYLISHLSVDGNDLLKLNIENKQIPEILNKILVLVVIKTIKNEKQEIIEYIKANFTF